MKYNTATLANGLRIIHLPATSQVVYCGFGINAGTRNELPGEEGVAHFCEHTTFKGTERRRALNIINCLETVGGEINAFTNKEDTVYYAAILKEHFPKAVGKIKEWNDTRLHFEAVGEPVDIRQSLNDETFKQCEELGRKMAEAILKN